MPVVAAAGKVVDCLFAASEGTWLHFEDYS
jgi:hypothetical protein